ncbi:hypothetical protein TTHERM_00925580 (macronuclear) [Tetrahymena thermophila SB210]|uniref:Phorbol-ester/DAG-type domain-containing protein n=1 Tax=Tetrahymena thermophila (strain SB210) TaxID=312017 RepID=Q22E01_TETTS|nr:hypothetical protein TTHERM_00925580 [Tetrahymena thermophila SB210]EAR83511.1 hypothetical protein TTHERM_00925580 [Tetrahymena thermophila SB210]|eukprot:XP_001031174.1 hypothetical protein TTHERM_00925580 [Tetrahymena thermophila SB210]
MYQQQKLKVQLQSLELDFGDISMHLSKISLSAQTTQARFTSSNQQSYLSRPSNQIDTGFVCPSGHILQESYQRVETCTCDSCFEPGFDGGNYVLSCSQCDYDLCLYCKEGYEDQKMQNICSNQGSKICPEGHYLTVRQLKQSNNTYCDNCFERADEYGSYTLRCKYCDFDICAGCESKYKLQKVLQCVNSHPLRLNFDRILRNMCDLCKTPCKKYGIYALTCEDCDFDICIKCKDQILKIRDS